MSKRIISAIVLLLLLTGCVSGTLLGRNYQRISPGMTKDDVVTYIGYPKNKQFGGNTEAWQYCATGVYTDFHVLVWIENDTVIGMQTYSNNEGWAKCGAGFRTINWEDKPNSEIR